EMESVPTVQHLEERRRLGGDIGDSRNLAGFRLLQGQHTIVEHRLDLDLEQVEHCWSGDCSTAAEVHFLASEILDFPDIAPSQHMQLLKEKLGDVGDRSQPRYRTVLLGVV